MALFLIQGTGYSLFKLMDTTHNSHDPLIHLFRERMVNQQGYKELTKWVPRRKYLVQMPTRTSRVSETPQWGNCFWNEENMKLWCKTNSEKLLLLGVKPAYICLGLCMMTNVELGGFFFQCRINTVFTQDLIFKTVCLFYSLGFMKSSKTPTYKILTSS